VMAITQLRCEPRAQAIYSNARANLNCRSGNSVESQRAGKL
jgi:hypothetical protein